MLVDTQPATHQHMPASPEVRDEWVTSQLIGVLMDSAMPSLLAAAFSEPGGRTSTTPSTSSPVTA